jgi:hypothetical protein
MGEEITLFEKGLDKKTNLQNDRDAAISRAPFLNNPSKFFYLQQLKKRSIAIPNSGKTLTVYLETENELVAYDTSGGVDYLYSIKDRHRDGVIAALQLFYMTHSGNWLIRNIPFRLKDREKWQTTKLSVEVKGVRPLVEVNFREMIPGETDAQVQGVIDSVEGLTGEVALYQARYRIYVRIEDPYGGIGVVDPISGSVMKTKLSEPVVSVAHTLFHEFLHIWFSHWSHDPRKDSMDGVIRGVKEGIHYPSGHGNQRYGETEKMFSDMIAQFLTEARTKVAKVWAD